MGKLMKKDSSVDIVYNYIKEQIAKNAIFPGNSIVEEDLAQKTGVSRISVRGALTRLYYEGYIESRPNHSAKLIAPSKADMTDIFEARLTVESRADALALKNKTPAQIRRIKALLEEEEKIGASFSVPDYVRINRELHFEMINGCGNPYYIKFLNEIYNKCDIYLLFFDRSQTNEASKKTHRKLVEAFLSDDEQGIAEALKEDFGLVTF